MKFFYCFLLYTAAIINIFSMQYLPAQTQEIPTNNKTVMLAVLARNKAHTLPAYFACLENLDYDKKLLSIYINSNNNCDQTKEIIEDWIAKNQHLYNKIIFENHEVKITDTRPHEWTPERFKILATIRNKSLKKAQELGTDYYFVVDCDNFITANTLNKLIEQNKPIIAPMLTAIPEKVDFYSNYFCDISEDGYYKDHPDYMKILQRQKIGTFKVPVVHCTYLIQSQYLDQLNYIDETDQHEFVIFSRSARNKYIDQYICNECKFGILLHFHNDLSLEEEKNRIASINISQLISQFKNSR